MLNNRFGLLWIAMHFTFISSIALDVSASEMVNCSLLLEDHNRISSSTGDNFRTPIGLTLENLEFLIKEFRTRADLITHRGLEFLD